MQEKVYLAIDLKSFYASVECVERGLNPMTTNLLVADESRTDKTICLAVSPALKALGVPGRPRLFEAKQRVREVNAARLRNAPGRVFAGRSWDAEQLRMRPDLEVDFIVAPPRMAHYMACSTAVYRTYLEFIAPEDIHVYSVDEVFIDATPYLKTYGLTPYELTQRIIRQVLHNTGITATAGIGTNLYLAKIAMDIVAKRMPADADGVRIAQLDEQSYRELLWDHRPLTDFWRIGQGYRKRLEKIGLYTMGDIARCSLGSPTEFYNEDLLYKTFGINAQLLIDHAWGWEPCTIADIKQYRPATNSISSGQVLSEPTNFDTARLIAREMVDLLSLDLVDKGLVTDQLVLTVGYDIENLTRQEIRDIYHGPITTDHYGRKVPKHAHGTANLARHTASTHLLTESMMDLFDRITDPRLLIRRLTLCANRVIREEQGETLQPYQQMDLFADPEQDQQRWEALIREKRRQKTILHLQKKYGKNAVLKGMNLQKGATAVQRNSQIGGHKK